MRQELEMARVVQMSTLPATMPALPGYDLYGTFAAGRAHRRRHLRPCRCSIRGCWSVLGDATGHGIAPALSVTQMQAMLRMAFRLGADLDTAFVQVNNQLAETLPGDRFITAFIGLLDPATHRMRFHSGGQGPILHFQAASGACARHQPDELSAGRDAALVGCGRRSRSTSSRATSCVLLSDGILRVSQRETASSSARSGSRAIVAHPRRQPMAELLATLLRDGATPSRRARRRRTT